MTPKPRPGQDSQGSLIQWLIVRPLSRLIAKEANENEVLLRAIDRKLDRVIQTLEGKMTATLQEILTAQEEGGKITIQTLDNLAGLVSGIASEQEEFIEAIERATAGTIPVSSLAPVLDKLRTQNDSLTRIRDGIRQSSESVRLIVPTIPSPPAPTPDPEPIPTPTPEPGGSTTEVTPVEVVPTDPAPVETVPVPTTPEAVVIAPSPEAVGLPDVPQIDVS